MKKGKDPDPDPYLWLMDPDSRGPEDMWILRIRFRIPRLAETIHFLSKYWSTVYRDSFPLIFSYVAHHLVLNLGPVSKVHCLASQVGRRISCIVSTAGSISWLESTVMQIGWQISTAMRQDHCRPSLAISENKAIPKKFDKISISCNKFNNNHTRSKFKKKQLWEEKKLAKWKRTRNLVT